MTTTRPQKQFAKFLVAAVMLLAFAQFLPAAEARTWTSSDGAKTFEGELKLFDSASGMVTVVLNNGSAMTFAQDKLSEAGIAFLKTQGGESSGGGAKKVPDELPDPDGKEADMSQPVQVFILMGQSNMLGFGKVDGDAAGTLAAAVKEGKYPFLVGDEGSWTTRKDVRNVRVMNFADHKNDWLTAADTKNIGPEIGIGSVLGEAIDAPVLILKSCIGNRSLGWDLLPPGSDQFEHEGKVYAGYKDSPDSWNKGNVATVYANPLSKGGASNSHYNGNAETYMDVGLALGRAMAKLLTP